MDSATNVYVVDQFSHTIRKITSGGMVSTVADLAGTAGCADATGGTARFTYPQGIATDGAGNLYVADSYNHTVRAGRVASLGPPLLGFNAAADQVTLSWRVEASTCALEASGTVGPSASWVQTTNSVTPSSGNFVVTDPVAPGTKFYRLRVR